MQKIKLILIGAAALLAGNVVAQNPPKKATKIIVTDIRLIEVAAALMEQGYLIDKLDPDHRFVVTKPKVDKKAALAITLQAFQKDSAVTINGTFSQIVTVSLGRSSVKLTDVQIENRGMKGSPLKNAFEAMDNFARTLKKPIRYE